MKVHITYELARSLNQRVCAILGCHEEGGLSIPDCGRRGRKAVNI